MAAFPFGKEEKMQLPFISRKQLSELMACETPKTVDRRFRINEIDGCPHVRLGGEVFFLTETLEKWMREQETTTGGERES